MSMLQILFMACDDMVILGLFVGSFWLGTAAGLLLARLWARMAQGQAKGFGIHTLYWHLPGNVFKRLPASWHRDFLG